MKRNQIIYGVLLIGATVLASYRGGVVSYGLFYTVLVLPLIALLYTFCVYKMLEFYQHTPDKIVEKGKILPYQVFFKNESFIPFTRVKVNFYEKQCNVEGSHLVTEYCLLPGDEKKLETTLKCFYRGTYSVGVNSIEIMDFLYLFKIVYPVMWPLELNVLPKVVHLKSLSILPSFEDPKVSYDPTRTESMLLETEMRKYQPGDPMKHINWKVSAKTGELLTRKLNTEVKKENVVLFDLSPIEAKDYSGLAIEDKILEIVLAIGNYMQTSRVKVTIGYEEKGLKEVSIHNAEEFGQFYHECGKIHFNADHDLGYLATYYFEKHPAPAFCMLVVAKIDDAFCKALQSVVAHGHELAVLYVCEEKSPIVKQTVSQIEALGIKFYWINPEELLDEAIG